MRLGLLGPADGDTSVLREAVEFLVGDASVDQAIYLGADDAVDRVIAEWAEELVGGRATENAFLDRVVELAPHGAPAALEKLLAGDAAVQRLDTVRKLPPPPARAIEMLDDRIVLLVHDKAVLDQDDIANAHIVVYGKSPVADLKRFGHRYFFTPGPVRARKVGIIEFEEDGSVTIALYEPSGAPLFRETLERRTGKLVVAP